MFAAFAASLAAQNAPDAGSGSVADSQLAGTIHAPDGNAVPGATLQLIQTSTGKAWITWTDENGKFEFPALPEGHFRVESSQLGFAPTDQEVDLESGKQTLIDVRMNVGTLAAISAPPPSPASSEALSAPPAPPSVSGAPASNSVQSPAPGSGAIAANPSERSQRAGTGPGQVRSGSQDANDAANRQGSGRRAFQQLGLNRQGQNPEDSAGEDRSLPLPGGELGQAASADAVQMMGTVAVGQADTRGPQQAGGSGPDTRGFGNGDTIPGQAPPAGFGGQGGPPGGFDGGPGGGFGGGPRGGAPPRGRGPRGAPQGVDALWGAQRVARQRINRVHYSSYDTFGDSAFNARPYSLYEANPPKISSWTETAGLNMGGPLKIPRVYDGTDKTFFYLNFGGTWQRTPVDQFATVPTAAERNGDFSADSVQLYDPLSNLTGPRSLMTNSGCFQATLSSPLPPAGTCIPTGRISQQSVALLNYIPLPNIPVTNLGGQNFNYHLQTNLPGISSRVNANVTHQINTKLSLQVSYNFSNNTSHLINSFPGVEGNVSAHGQAVTIGLTQNWTKTFMHTSQLSFSRGRSLITNGFSNVTDIGAQLGLSGISTNPVDYGLPTLNFTNFTGINDPNFSLSRSQTYRYVDSFRWMKARHTVSAGGEIRKIEIDRDTDPVPNGFFSFTGLMTSQLDATGAPVFSPAICQPAAPCIGNDFADFLLGYPQNTRLQYGDTATYFHNWGFIAYASDDWHMLPKFTITYGIRYEAFTPPVEENGHVANLAVSPGFTSVQCVTPAATGNCAAGPTASLFQGRYNNWAPRVAIAWQPPGKLFSGQHQMTVRAGFGMFYVESYLNQLSSEMANQPPFATTSTLTQQTATAPPLSLATNLASSLPGSFTNSVGVNPNYQVPYAMLWNLGSEYNLPHNMVLEVTYTGTRGVHLDELLGFSSVTSGTANAAGFVYDTTGAFSNFHAIQVRFQKRMSRGLGFMARYTYSKSLDDASSIGGGAQVVIQNSADPRGDYGLSTFNMTHQFMGMLTYQLPFGERQRFANKGWGKAVFGDWRLNASSTANSGTPFTVRVFSKNQACQNVPGTNSERANQLGNSGLADPTIQQWFDTAAFSIPTSCFGDSPRNSVIGPGSFTLNSGLTKTVQFGRDGLRRLDFSWNATNLLNHPNYTGLSTVLGSRTFGEITSVGAMRAMSFTTRLNF